MIVLISKDLDAWEMSVLVSLGFMNFLCFTTILLYVFNSTIVNIRPLQCFFSSKMTQVVHLRGTQHLLCHWIFTQTRMTSFVLVTGIVRYDSGVSTTEELSEFSR